MLDINEVKVNNNVNLNVIKNIKNKNIISSKLIDAKTLSSSWFQPTVNRSDACLILRSSKPGNFLVRRSSSCDALVLSMAGVMEEEVFHLLILTNQTGVRVQGTQKVFPNIYSLIIHLSIMQESLPCNLLFNTSESDTETSDYHDDDMVDIGTEPELETIIAKMQEKMVWG